MAIRAELLCLTMPMAMCLGCYSLPGPRYPPPSPPLIDEPAKTVDVLCIAKEAGQCRGDDLR
ncbi:MAG: hypothetical protein JW959_04330 [Pirellulales bacterium]|nr:hypothetical protein [Pirellulales bacterium]